MKESSRFLSYSEEEHDLVPREIASIQQDVMRYIISDSCMELVFDNIMDILLDAHVAFMCIAWIQVHLVSL